MENMNPFQAFLAQIAGVAHNNTDMIPHEDIPAPCQEPVWTDPTIPNVDMSAAFSPAHPALTDPNEGIRSQKTNRNITEIVDAIVSCFAFLVIGGILFFYQSPIWVMIEGYNLMRFVSDAIRHLFPDDAPYLSSRDRREIAEQLRCHPATKHLERLPNMNYDYLCCQDSMYDWHSGKLIPHDGSFYSFFALKMNASDIGNCEGRYWEKFLYDLTAGDDTLRQRILEVIGVILTGYPTKAFFLLQGAGNTGKSQLVNFIRYLLGESACFALNDVSQLGDKFTPGALWGKLLCLCGDMPDAPLSSKAIGTIKQLTGEDLIRGEIKYKNAFTFDNTAKLLFVSNYPLQIPNAQQEQALLDRLVVIPCRNSIPKEEQIPQLYQHLLEEAGYIVDLAMDALRDFEERNGVFTPLTESVVEGAISVPDADQSLMDFIQDRCVLEDGAKCSVGELFDAYCDYEPEEHLDRTQFTKRLIRCFPSVETFRTGKERGYKGIRLVDIPLN